jgi:hypothetical protein
VRYAPHWRKVEQGVRWASHGPAFLQKMERRKIRYKTLSCFYVKLFFQVFAKFYLDAQSSKEVFCPGSVTKETNPVWLEKVIC